MGSNDNEGYLLIPIVVVIVIVVIVVVVAMNNIASIKVGRPIIQTGEDGCYVLGDIYYQQIYRVGCRKEELREMEIYIYIYERESGCISINNDLQIKEGALYSTNLPDGEWNILSVQQNPTQRIQ